MEYLSDTSPIVLVIALIVALFIWGAGYKLYRLAVFFLGFLAGFILCGTVVKLVPSPPVSVIVIQIAVGLAMGAASFFILKLGLFIAAGCAVFFVLNNLFQSQSMGSVGLIIAFAAAVVAGFIATKADKPVIMVFTGILGGFAIISILYKIALILPIDTSILPPERSLVVIAVKAVLALAGIGIQFAVNREKNNE